MVITITGTQDREGVSFRAREEKLLVIFVSVIQQQINTLYSRVPFFFCSFCSVFQLDLIDFDFTT